MRVLFLLLILVSARCASASPEGPIASYFSYADKVLLVRVTAMDQRNVSLEVVKALKGVSNQQLTLQNRDADLHEGSEYLILSSSAWRAGQDGNFIGSFFKGDLGWIYASTKKEGSQVYIDSSFLKDGRWIYDKGIDGLDCITLSHAETLLSQAPPKP
jgi:hypothetical protein